MTSVTAILEDLNTGAEPHLRKIPMQADDVYNRIPEMLSFCLPHYCAPLYWHHSSDITLSLQQWLDLWLKRQISRLHLDLSMTFPSGPAFTISLINPPQSLFFEVTTHTQIHKIMPTALLLLPCNTGIASYQLKGAVYLGDGHFSAWLISETAVWTYDGRINDGCPHTPEQKPSLFSDLSYWMELGESSALVYVYGLHDIALTVDVDLQPTRSSRTKSPPNHLVS